MNLSRQSRTARRIATVFAVGLSLGAVGGGYNLVSAQVSSDERPVFISVNPCRLVDTRPGDGNVGPIARKVGGNETLNFRAHGPNGECTGASAIPTDAVALSVNVTALGATEGTFLTLWGAGANPGTSNLNPIPGQPPIPNAVNTPLSDSGSFNLFNAFGDVHVIIDVNGYYADHDHDDRYYTKAESDARYAQLSLLPFLASGTVEDDVNPSLTAVTGFSGPPGVTATVTDGGPGVYRVQLNNTGALTAPVIQVTGVGDLDPGAASGATACALATERPSVSNDSMFFDIGCFGDNDTSAGSIAAEDISFQFIVVD